MNSRALRRLASDHAALHAQLPPNYFFSPDNVGDALTELDILLTGPTHTPFAGGVWKLHLNIPPTYPQQPPTAHFRTPIFHPNVDPQTGGVCVETLKRDWDAAYTLSHVLQTISCLLIQPNPDSALNADAGALLQEGYDVYARRAALMTSINAAIPASLRAAALEAQTRGGQEEATEDMPVRRRRPIAQARARAAARSPPAAAAPPRRAPVLTPTTFPSQPLFDPAGQADLYGQHTPPHQSSADAMKQFTDDDTMTDADQENEHRPAHHLPASATPVPAGTPRRPHGAPVPLGEMILDEVDEDLSDDDMEPEYPPSPRKSPSKSPAKKRRAVGASNNALLRAVHPAEGSSRGGNRNITPLNAIDKPLAEDSPFAATFSPSPRKARPRLFETPASPAYQVSRSLFGRATNLDDSDMSLFGPAPTMNAGLMEVDDEREEQRKRCARNDQLWELCGRDVKRWNQGDFDGQIIRMKAPRW